MDEDTIIIFGRSPYINDVKTIIPKLIKKYHTIGINQFYQSFSKVEYTCFCDLLRPEELVNVKSKLIMTPISADYWKAYKNKEVFELKNNKFKFSSEANVLNYFFHTPTFAMNYAYQKDFKNCILIGIDLISNTAHFDDTEFVPDWLDDKIIEAREHIENVCTQYLNVYTVNPKSVIKIPYKDITSL